jgi:hypothetical protein
VAAAVADDLGTHVRNFLQNSHYRSCRRPGPCQGCDSRSLDLILLWLYLTLSTQCGRSK